MAKVAPAPANETPTEGVKPTLTSMSTRASLVHSAVTKWRSFLHTSGWYDSPAALSIRKFLRGRFFAIVAMICLFLALFLSDLFIVFEVEGNTVLDFILTIVFLTFLLEFIGLAATDPSYMFSFFFWMDLLGTASMIFDISFLAGSDASEAENYTGNAGEENVIVVRAARATKLGARAGRLSRVMKLLRFIPFLNGDTQESDVKMARVISSQLNNVLSTRVAFLTIMIVVVLPIFGMFTYPEVDDSLTAWPELLSDNVNELYALTYPKTGVALNATATALARRRLDTELNQCASFYETISYGPFDVCYSATIGGSVKCQNQILPITFNSTFKRPGRASFIRLVSHGNTMVKYDLSTPKQFESISNACLIVFIIITMCVFGLVTSSSISVIALHPLERMLKVVRERCQQIFKYTDELKEDEEEEEEEEEDYDDTEQSSEFALLERVVAKLAAIAHLSSTKAEPEVKEDMTENELMVLNWMQGTQVPVAKRRPSHLGAGAHEFDADEAVQKKVNESVNDDIPSEIVAALDTPHFNSVTLSKALNTPLGTYIILNHDGSSSWVRANVPESQLEKFVTTCESKYLPNPFHNFAHALDVEYACARFMKLIEAHYWMPESTQFWLMVSAVGHDLGHLGVNNQYLVETSHELAMKYNDRSPLENLHCATLFQVVSEPQANIFAQVDKNLYKEMRKGIIEAILHTDVTKHHEMMKELVMLFQMNSEVFEAPEHSEALEQVLTNHMQLAVNTTLHCSDVGNPMKPWELAQPLAYLCVDEFFAQGDCEKAAGIPVQFLNDRDKVNRPNSQIGFIEFMIAPMVEAIVHLFPTLDGMAENLGANIEHWFGVWVEEVAPAEEVASKTEARVKKVAARCQALMRGHVALTA